LTWFQRGALLFLAVAAVSLIYSYAMGGSRVGLLVMAVFVAFVAFRKQLLWRVRNRLVLTYILSGVVPLLLIFWLLELTTILLLGQFASERARQGLESRLQRVYALTQDLDSTAEHGGAPALLEEIRNSERGLSAVVTVNGRTVISALPGAALSAAPEWMKPEFRGAFEAGGRYYLGVNASGLQNKAQVFSFLPLDEETLSSIVPGVVAIAAPISTDQNTNMNFSPAGSRVAIVEKNGVRQPILFSQLPEAKNSWDVPLATLLSRQIATATGEATVLFPVLSRPSLVLAGVVIGRMASIAISVLLILAAVLLVVEVFSLIWSIRLTRTITRSADDLHRGTLYVAAGDFSQQIPVRGSHQLSDLATSFNGMTKQIYHYMGEMRKKEKLESELEIARQVQARLFPRAVPEIKTLQLAGVCLPSRFVSGDYYDFVRLDDRYVAIALGDVSGKGVSAALLMASIQSALHAQLKFSGAAASPSFSLATLMGLISQQLYENTPAEKYATFFCSVYDDQTGVLRYTNAGHLRPIVIRDGQSCTLPGEGMVAGLLPRVSYEQFEHQLQRGDLLAIFSDGIPEAENAAGEEFGEARLASLLAETAAKSGAKSLDEIIQGITGAVNSWMHDPESRDDITIVLARRV
jgi:sigma-B regulation protein RsbU (phosphoserine phosphatase)